MKSMREYSRQFAIAVFRILGIMDENDKKIPMGQNELCLMYALDDGKSHSQMQISKEWGISRTTLNTIVKRWEKDGLLTLAKIPGKRREMEISLTEQGIARAKSSLKSTYTAEDIAMEKTINRYSDTFVEAIEYYGNVLKQAFENVEKT